MYPQQQTENVRIPQSIKFSASLLLILGLAALSMVMIPVFFPVDYGHLQQLATTSAPAARDTTDELAYAQSMIRQQKNWTRFVENRGQVLNTDLEPATEVRYRSHINGLEIFLTDWGIRYLFQDYVYDPEDMDEEEYERELLGQNLYTVDFHLENANPGVKSTGISPEDYHTNYYMAHRPDGILEVPHYQGVVYQNVWDHIDWIIYATDAGIKHEFMVHPGADPDNIRLRIKGGEKIRIGQGNLLVETPYGMLEEQAPYSFMIDKNGQQKEVSSQFVLDQDILRFEVDWQGLNTLVIDPDMVWATYFGGTNREWPYAMTLDNNGDLYVGGTAVSVNYPVNDPGGGAYYQASVAGSWDGTIIKFGNNGNRVWATFYGGTGFDRGIRSLATDNAGNVFATGETNANDFPLQNPGSGAYFQATQAGQEMFLLKFDAAGQRLWGTYYGGSGSDVGWALTVSGTNDLIVTGQTTSANFPLLDPGGGAYFQSTPALSTSAFILKFTNSGQRIWSTYFSGLIYEVGNCVVTDAANNIYIGGQSGSNDLPVLDIGGGAFYQSTPSNAFYDCFIARFDPNGVREWVTYFGGNNHDNLYSLKFDGIGNLFATGDALSTNFPIVSPCPASYSDASHGGGNNRDMFLMKFGTNLDMQWSTYIGGANEDYNDHGPDRSIGIDAANNVYFIFATYSTTLPVVCPGSGFSRASDGDESSYIAVFDNDGVPIWATHIDSLGEVNHSEDPVFIDIDNAGNIFTAFPAFTGGSPPGSSDLPRYNPGGGAYVQTFGGNAEIYIAKFSPLDCIGGSCGPLPVELLEFTARQADERVELSWVTASEIDNDYFIIERSHDGKHFEILLQRDGAGTSSVRKEYRGIDQTPHRGTNYYRLMQVDLLGNQKHMALTTVTLVDQGFEIKGIENPVVDELSFFIQSAEATAIHVEIYDLLGKIYLKVDQQLDQGLNQTNIPVDHLPSGTYILKIIRQQNHSVLEQKKIVVY